MGVTALMGSMLPFGEMKIFGDLMEVLVAQHCECSKCHQIFSFKMVKFIMLREF